MNQPQLSLWEKVIFVDWHGVMSTDPFWESVLAQKTKLGSGLRIHLSKLFRSDTEIVDRWMRGEVTTSEVVEPTRRHFGKNHGSDFLERRIVEDCRMMSVDGDLASLFASLRDRVLIVLATDNTAEFETAFRAAKGAPTGRPNDQTPITPTLNRIARNFDDILCSASIGVLKAENPDVFFGTWLSQHSMPIYNSLLIDDRQDNCQAFRRLGGRAINWDDSTGPKPDRLAQIRDFVGTAAQADSPFST